MSDRDVHLKKALAELKEITRLTSTSAADLPVYERAALAMSEIDAAMYEPIRYKAPLGCLAMNSTGWQIRGVVQVEWCKYEEGHTGKHSFEVARVS